MRSTVCRQDDSLVVLLIDVEAVGQTGEEGLHYHVVHGQPCFQAPKEIEEECEALGMMSHVLCASLYTPGPNTKIKT